MAEPAPEALPASRLANHASPLIVEAFDSYRREFRALTRQARRKFEARDWGGALADAALRLDLYTHVIQGLERQIRSLLGQRVDEREVWTGMKAVHSALVAGRSDAELAETFFNSLTRRIFATAGVDQNIEYVDSDFDLPPAQEEDLQLRCYPADRPLAAVLGDILHDGWFESPFADLAAEAEAGAQLLAAQLQEVGLTPADVESIELLHEPLFRRKGAYLLGHLRCADRDVPLVLALVHPEAGIRLDAVLTDVDDVSILFSFTRSHFLVDLDPPHQLVRYLKRLLPNKPLAELYIAVGHHKHGKTELYRDLLGRLHQGEDQFDIAPGTPGLVMVVFTLGNHDVVFKVIRDHFPPIKPVTLSGVRDNYRLVFRHDRAGRLVEAQEFEHLKFDRGRFTERLIAEFQREADRVISLDADEVVVHHSYLERRVTPLDVFLRGSAPEAVEAAIIDFGQAVKDLAINNIFPGELLPKNFGVTRHGRVVCYDYDELGLLTDFTFRRLPTRVTEDDELADEAPFGVTARDVFPEEFEHFIGLPTAQLQLLREHHPDLFDETFWQETQARVGRGEIIDIFPYPARRRLGAAGHSPLAGGR